MDAVGWILAAGFLGSVAAAIRLRRSERAAQARIRELTAEISRQGAELEHLRESDERARQSHLFGGVGTWDWLIDRDDLHWSDEVHAMFGFTPGEVTPSYSLFCSMVHPDDAERVREGETRCVDGATGHDEEYRIIRTDGAVRWLRETGNVIRDADGRPYRMVGVVRDVTDEKLRERDVLRLACHDPLTGLPNRAGFRSMLQDALVRANGREGFVVLAMVEATALDGIRERLGHAHGDEAATAFAARLASAAGQGAGVARLDASLFAVIIEDVTATKAAAPRCDALLAGLAGPLAVGPDEVDLAPCLGASVYPSLAPSAEGLAHCADLALLRAKALRAGKAVLFPVAE